MGVSPPSQVLHLLPFPRCSITRPSAKMRRARVRRPGHRRHSTPSSQTGTRQVPMLARHHPSMANMASSSHRLRRHGSNPVAWENAFRGFTWADRMAFTPHARRAWYIAINLRCCLFLEDRGRASAKGRRAVRWQADHPYLSTRMPGRRWVLERKKDGMVVWMVAVAVFEGGNRSARRCTSQ